MSGTNQLAKAVAVGVLAALLTSVPAQASIYRVNFTALIDAAWYTNDATIDSNCTPGTSGESNNCDWTVMVGQVAFGHWIFGSENAESLNGIAGQPMGFDVVIPALRNGSFLLPPGTQENQPSSGSMNAGIWRAFSSADNGSAGTRRDISVVINPGAALGDVPNLSTASSTFTFDVRSSLSANYPGYCPLNDTSIQFPGFPSAYGSCGGKGHLTAISVSKVDEPATMALAAAALLGILAARRRKHLPLNG